MMWRLVEPEMLLLKTYAGDSLLRMLGLYRRKAGNKLISAGQGSGDPSMAVGLGVREAIIETQGGKKNRARVRGRYA